MPAIVSILFALAKLVVPQKMFCRSVGLHDGHNAARLVSAGVEANNGERRLEVCDGLSRMLYASSIGAYVEQCEWLERATAASVTPAPSQESPNYLARDVS